MKWSKYNTIITNGENNFILYNCNTNKVMAFVAELKTILDENIDNLDKINSIHPELYRYLCDNKFIIQEDYDELQDAIDNKQKQISDAKYFGITINPTLNCNLKCWYCYEKHIPDSYMTESTMNAIKKLLTKKIESKDIQYINLGFFGGEPLLKFKSTISNHPKYHIFE